MTVATSPHPKSPSVWRAWWMIAVLSGLYILSFLDRQIVSMLVEDIRDDLAINDFEISLILGPSFAICYALFGLPMGLAADRLPRRWVIFCGAVFWSCSTVLGGLARSFGGLLAARSAVGIGEASLLPSTYSLIADSFPPNRINLATSVFQSAGSLGVAAAFAIGGIIIGYAERTGIAVLPLIGPMRPWQLTMILAGALPLVASLLVFTFSEPARAQLAPSSTPLPRLREALRGHASYVASILVAFSTVMLTGFTLNTWGPVYMARQFGWSASQYGSWLGLANLIGAAWLICCGRLLDVLETRGTKYPHLKLQLALVSIAAPSSILMFLTRDPHMFMALFSVSLMASVPAIVNVAGLFTALAGNHAKGRMMSLFVLCYTIVGLGLGQTLVGALSQFLFVDPAMLGYAMMVVVVPAYALSMLLMWQCLKALGSARSI